MNSIVYSLISEVIRIIKLLSEAKIISIADATTFVTRNYVFYVRTTSGMLKKTKDQGWV